MSVARSGLPGGPAVPVLSRCDFPHLVVVLNETDGFRRNCREESVARRLPTCEGPDGSDSRGKSRILGSEGVVRALEKPRSRSTGEPWLAGVSARLVLMFGNGHHSSSTLRWCKGRWNTSPRRRLGSSTNPRYRGKSD